MSDTDRLEFIREVLRTAPAGQFTYLLENIQKLSKIDDELMKEVEQKYEKQVCAGTSSSSGGESSHPLTAPLKKEIEEYQRGYDGANGLIARREIVPGVESSQLLLRTYAERVDEEKCRTGNWAAEWTIQSEPGSSTAQLSGQVNICVFSYEDGNVQIRSAKEFPSISIDASESELAQAIVQQISTCEAEVLHSIRDSYTQVSKDLKAIRGILPITHTRLNWSVVTQRTVRNLQETVKK